MNFGSGLQDLSSMDHAKIDKFRIQVSLGSVIEVIGDISAEGFTVNYTEGDVCNKQTG